MKLFEQGHIGRLSLKNRIVMAPMGTRLHCPDGRLAQRAIDYYVARARGGTGLIITGSVGVIHSLGGQSVAPIYPFADDKVYVTRLNELAEAVHDYGARVSVQLHAGLGRATAPAADSDVVVAPSRLPVFGKPELTTREMSADDIRRLVRAYEIAAEVVCEAGIDCIDIHAHKGALVDQFMTPLWNMRTDEYGGDLENRLRFPIEVIRAIKKGAGADFPVTFRYGLIHYLEGGREIEEGLAIARRLEAAGADALLIDAGCEETIYWIHPPTTLPPGCMVDLAARTKEVVSIPVIAVGKLGYPMLAEEVLQAGKADFVALGRQLLADPEWPNKVREGRFEDICPCIGDHEGCEARISNRKYISCTVNPAVGMERDFALTPAERRKTVLVVGGGPAGMEAALISAKRGHRVTLVERNTDLGGNLNPASAPGFKQDYARLRDYLVSQVKKAGVIVELGKEATLETVKTMKPDAVFIATGAASVIPEIPGIDTGTAVTAIDLLLGKKEAGETVVVIGGGVAGTEAALYLAQKGRAVTIVEICDSVARNVFHKDNRLHLLKLLGEAKVRILTETRVLEITEKGAMISDKDGRISFLDADTVVLAVGLRSEDKLSKALASTAPEVFTIGDCVQPRKVINAIWEAFRTARLV
ncbi:MAG: FAD-dependent oxidoreductase [Chloroflexi bacterium]|nr:FAD-dependent oxidoreductase [Chloroflexota bacterium]